MDDLFSQEHLTDFELAGTFECNACGAIVRDTRQHEVFHDIIAELCRKAGVTE